MSTRARVRVSAVTVICVVGLTISSAHGDVFHGHWIGGRIAQTYHRLGGWERFGDATTPETAAARNGRFQVFTRDASIYWHPQVDNGVAHQVGGRIRDKWADHGWERAALGYPLTDELSTANGTGRFNHFQGGSIYWSPETDAHQVWGIIRDKWVAHGSETGVLGYPISDERATPDRKGRYNHFQGGSIYFSHEGGAHAVTGAIRDFWAKSGWEKSYLGYPASDQYSAGGGIKQDFLGGSIQRFEPTGVALERYDDRAHSSYRQVYPLFTVEDHPRWHAAGAHRELIQHMDSYFPLKGCPQEISTGTVCTFSSVDGRSGRVTVDRVSDTGFSLVTAHGHPEGTGRTINIRFDEVTAPPTDEADVVLDSPEIEAAYAGSDKTWIRLVVECFGPTVDAQVQGPFNSDHVGSQVWEAFVTTLRTSLDASTTTYVPLAR